ncbi:polyhydroxyalkanoate synthesis repressor PhaR [Labrenzia sp. EL_13]|uniref:polyhydroxyalkanoate synthesis repressor PhaR n=1 Tax=Roseibium album TaxID=311410 RepID=UPI000CF08F9E|nr:polyhydroxyalkanoate synthesis repressor PhaR [Roseibium album]MBG6145710.1 polyhydroxyalkanoate synthesis repressor PhaR [Labrenzia sp. EL_142]MBG6157596.1 polyhydroxyalkanoate synthesis repressor PhaR [Labrenzia sp. EL_162]MBG6196011.1 polyhydroxyalkanoate synthesis repressor PhaR [Labrenzia sp. EL_159]MBG6201434.1 polyhydroxyalkanoate synthesis repressor PhaR [Labrenzia sp. EL_13]
MAKTNEPTIIKKYANRRLYNTGTSTYVTLEDLAVMVKGEEDFVVFDAKSGDDITRSVLTQIIFEQEGKGQNLLPVTFLRQLIRFYGDSMQGLVPSFLEYSMTSLTKEQEKLRSQMSEAFGATAFDAIEDQVKRNTEMFERAMKMFMPFPAGEAGTAEGSEPAAGTAKKEKSDSGDLDQMKRQLEEMQKKINKLTDKS